MTKTEKKPPSPQRNEPLSVEKWVDVTIRRAVQARASDIHIEPAAETFAVRYRVDGVLHQIDEQPREHHDAVVSRIKILANLNSIETRRPQDGHIVTSFAEFINSKIDLRVSTFPTIFGEAAALRILNRQDFLFDTFEAMGMDHNDAEVVRTAIQKPHGLILATGPSGVGKTTTLYTAINQIRTPSKNIITLEDPVEYQLELVRHAQINPDIGFTFAVGLRSLLRQDPDVIMIGEIRDDESSEITVRAALSGRLVFSTMHTNDSVGAVVRFLEFGMPRSFVANSLRLVIAQRLLRLNCAKCTQPYTPTENSLKESGLAVQEGMVFSRGTGCDACYHTGYSGRRGIFELFVVDREMELLILEGATYRELWQATRGRGQKTLREQAIRLALEGKTALEEAVHMTA